MSQIATLNCPNCGAAVSKDSSQCQYCSALLKTVACPSCFGLMFLGTKFCPHCGAAAQSIKPEAQTNHPCPRCQTHLQSITVGKTPLEQCPHCGGLWVNSAIFEQICSDREAQAAAIGLNLPPPVQIDQAVFYIKCPQCHTMMNRMNYAHHSGIILDICRNHGIWLDRDELRKIIEFIRAGGLDVARRTELEQLERKRSELEALREPSNTSPIWSNSAENSSCSYPTTDLLGGLASVIRWLMK